MDELTGASFSPDGLITRRPRESSRTMPALKAILNLPGGRGERREGETHDGFRQKNRAAALMEKEKHTQGPVYPVETERELITFVQCGNKKQANRTLTRLLGEIFSFAGGNIDTIRVRLFELIAFFSRTAIETGASLSGVNDITKNSFEIINYDVDFEKICCFTGQIMERYIDIVSQNHEKKPVNRHLSRALDYITLNYADNLSLNTVAGAIFVSGYYLSHLFRKEMNTTFSDYVCKIRIDKAKTLLKKDGGVRIQEITEKVGFNDPNYFAKSFKKMTGVSPKEYQAFFK
jgi:two-component system response regulator YesN